MQERELKIELDEASAVRLMRVLGCPAETVLQDNHYLDDEDGRLREARCGLRLRRRLSVPPPSSLADAVGWLEALTSPADTSAESTTPPDELGRSMQPAAREPGSDSAWVLSLKGPSRTAGVLFERAEYESPVEPEQAERLVAGEAAAQVFAQSPLPSPLLEACSLGVDLNAVRVHGAARNLRQRYGFPDAPREAAESTQAHLELDLTRYPDGFTGFELELEIGTGDALDWESRLHCFLDELGVPWKPATRGKYARYRGHLGHPGQPGHPGHPGHTGHPGHPGHTGRRLP